MTCDQRRDLLLLYAFDALEATEAEEMRQHLQSGCPACAGSLAEAQAVASSLPLALDPVTPPPQAKARLMQRIEMAQMSVPILAPLPKPENRPENREASRPQGDSLPLRLFRLFVPAAVAAGLAIIATHAVMNQKLTDLQQHAAALEHEEQTLLTTTLNQGQQLALLKSRFHSQTQVVELLQSPDLKLVHLDPTKLQPHAVANLLWDQKQQQWAIVTFGMTPAAPGETYELWFVPVTGAPVAAGTFDVDSSGNGSLCVAIPPGIGPLKMAAVTNEKGRVEQPRGSFQVAGSL